MINFEVIADKIHKNLDTDLMDIKRNGIEIYSNVACNIQIKQEDNPDPTTIDVTPIISSLEIHMPNYVDIENNDYIIAKRMSHDNKILEVYRGVCGYPSVWQSRKSVSMAMNTLPNDSEVTPPEPIEQSLIKVEYKNMVGVEIKPSITKKAEIGKQVDLFPPLIEDYEFKNSYLDGLLQATPNITILEALPKGHNVLFEYDTSTKITYFRVLLNGVYTMDNGTVSSGYHLYKKLPIIKIEGENGNYRIVTDIDRFVHDDNGEIVFKVGTKLKLYSSNEWVKIISNPIRTIDGYEFETALFVPTEAEKNAYITNWYGE